MRHSPKVSTCADVNHSRGGGEPGWHRPAECARGNRSATKAMNSHGKKVKNIIREGFAELLADSLRSAAHALGVQ
jgi:hypothetical protein